jgi:hypothetical protein
VKIVYRIMPTICIISSTLGLLVGVRQTRRSRCSGLVLRQSSLRCVPARNRIVAQSLWLVCPCANQHALHIDPSVLLQYMTTRETRSLQHYIACLSNSCF